MNLIPFQSWEAVLDYARTGQPLYYKAPMDLRPTSLHPGKGTPYSYDVRSRTIRIWPPGSVGRGRARTSDPFTADAGHLDRFSHVDDAARRGVGEARHELTGPFTDDIYKYRGASIELSSAGTRRWFATVRFRSQEKDFEARSSDEALELAKEWIDSALEFQGRHTAPPADYGKPYPREQVNLNAVDDWRPRTRGGVVPNGAAAPNRRPKGRPQAMEAHRDDPVDDPDYIVQGLYDDGSGAIDDFGYDDEGIAIREARRIAVSNWFEGDYVRVITRDGELVWDSREG